MIPSFSQYTIGEPFIELTTVESSNNYAMQQAQNASPKAGTAWFAYEQTSGKGQRGKRWTAEPGANIIMSVLLRTDQLHLGQQFTLSAAVAVACHEFFSAFAGEQTKVKFPNDIYWGDRKAAGILIENIITGSRWQWSVVGIGMNINQVTFPSIAIRPVSLRQITGRSHDSVNLAKELCKVLDKWVKRVNSPEEQIILKSYNDHLYKRGELTKFRKGNVLLQATVLEVDKNGQLWLGNGTRTGYSHGEVEWVI